MLNSEQRTEGMADAPDAPDAATLEGFWDPGPELDSLQVRVRAPDVALQVLQVLGEPSFAGDPNLQQRLAEVYAAVTRRALQVAYR
jgi:hypothetical protein